MTSRQMSNRFLAVLVIFILLEQVSPQQTPQNDEVPQREEEKGLSRSGNGRVRKILVQLSWRMLQFQPDSGLVRWFKNRTANSQRSRKPMIVALARKLIIALWNYVNTGVAPDGFKLAK